MVDNTEVKRLAVSKAMESAAERGWQAVSLRDVAARAGIALGDLYEVLPSKPAILTAFIEDVDRTMLAGAGVPTDNDSVRDRLFDLLMRRFDALTPYKAALRNILRDAGADPFSTAWGSRRLGRSMALALEAAGESSSGASGALKVSGVTAAYLYAYRAWLNDDSADMGRTMAALDKALRRGEALAEFLWRGRGPRPQPPTGDGPQEEAA